jgi:hypothetical protein
LPSWITRAIVGLVSDSFVIQGRIVKEKDTRKAYVAPVLVELGSLHGLTLQTKEGPVCDITCFHSTSVRPLP